jgi:hypothetical protein
MDDIYLLRVDFLALSIVVHSWISRFSFNSFFVGKITMQFISFYRIQVVCCRIASDQIRQIVQIQYFDIQRGGFE